MKYEVGGEIIEFDLFTDLTRYMTEHKIGYAKGPLGSEIVSVPKVRPVIDLSDSPVKDEEKPRLVRRGR